MKDLDKLPKAWIKKYWPNAYAKAVPKSWDDILKESQEPEPSPADSDAKTDS